MSRIKPRFLPLIVGQLLDSMLVCEFGRQPLLQLTDARSPLPCADKIWETPKIDQVVADTSEASM